MKVIDLLNKIANGEEVPKKIKYKDFIYEYWKEETVMDYRCYDEKTELYGYLSSCVDYETLNILNNEVEILEEEKKIPEKIKTLNANEYSKELYYENYSKEEIVLDIETLQNWVNKIIDYLDYLKSKGE